MVSKLMMSVFTRHSILGARSGHIFLCTFEVCFPAVSQPLTIGVSMFPSLVPPRLARPRLRCLRLRVSKVLMGGIQKPKCLET